METRTLGNTGLKVSTIGFGAGGIGDPSFSEERCARLLTSVVDSGINLIDTAHSYGLSEQRIGRHLQSRRKEIVLSTKIGYGIPGYQDWTPSIIEPAIDDALRTMQTDWIDIVHLHSCSLDVLLQDDLMDALLRAKDAGKIRAAAYSGDNEPLEWAVKSGKFDVLQLSINICDQYAIPFLQKSHQMGTGVIVKRALANASWRQVPLTVTGDSAADEYRHRWKQMQLDFKSTEAAEIAIRFAAYLPGVHCCLIGSTNPDHMIQNIRRVELGPLDPQIQSNIRSAFLKHGQDWKGKI